MNFDGGRYFLTVLAPINIDSHIDTDKARRSPSQILRQTLDTMPVAQQDPPSCDSGLNSPFARVPGTHFARFFILDELRYNGRRPSNAIYDLLAKVNLLRPEKIDDLKNPYLVFTVDFDAESGHETQLRAYTNSLWENAELELGMIFQHCIGFQHVSDADDFFTYIKKCQVETTMPYTDYWTGPLPEWTLPRNLSIAMGVVLALALAVWFGGAWRGSGTSFLLSTLLLAFAVTLGVVWREGSKIWPAAPHSDLRSVLKALYLQQNFVRFAIDNQGSTDEELFDAYGKFCATHRPQDPTGPTQPAGTLTSNGKSHGQ